MTTNVRAIFQSADEAQELMGRSGSDNIDGFAIDELVFDELVFRLG
jgi:hypothetical protein